MSKKMSVLKKSLNTSNYMLLGIIKRSRGGGNTLNYMLPGIILWDC